MQAVNENCKQVTSILLQALKTQKNNLWELINCENPDKKASFIKIEGILSLKEMIVCVKKIAGPPATKEEQSSLFILFKKNLNYLHERTIVLDLPKYFSELLEAEKNDLQNDIEKKKNWSPEEITTFLDDFVKKKDEEMKMKIENHEEEETNLNANEIEEENPEEIIEEWEDASNTGDDIIVVDEEEIKELDKDLDEEMFNDEEEEENEEEEKIQPNKISEEKIDESLKNFKFHHDFALGVHFHPSSQSIFSSCSGDGLAAIWDLNKETPQFILKGHTDTINFSSYNHDGTLLATGSLDGTIRIWEAKTGKLKYVLEGPSDEIRFIDWHKKGNAILAGSADNTVWLWNANNGEFMHIFQGHSDAITAGGFTPEGHLAISVSEDKTLRVWNPKTGEPTHKITGYGFHTDVITCLAFHNSLPVCLTGSADKTACLSNFSTGKILGKTMEHLDGIEAVLFSENLDIFLTGSIDGHLRIFDSAKFILKDDLTLDSGITKISFDPQEINTIVASSFEGKLYRFDQRKKGTDLKTYSVASTIHDFAINKNSEVVCACEDGVIRYFDLKK